VPAAVAKIAVLATCDAKITENGQTVFSDVQ